jgi:hypothetical protein
MTHLEFPEEQLKELSKEQGPNLFLYHNDTKSVVIISGEAWYMRIWLLLSNPFRYLFTVRVRY